MNNVEERVAYLEGRFEEQGMTVMDIREGVARLDGRLDRLERLLDERFDKLDTRFGWLVGLVVAMLIAVVAGTSGIIAAILQH